MNATLAQLPLPGLLSWLAMGLLAGAVARLVVARRQRFGSFTTLFVGLVGAVVGGALATALGFGGLSGFDVRSLVIATLGAALFLLMLAVARPPGARSTDE